MYLDRHDFRGILIVLSMLSFVTAVLLWIRTLDLEAGTYFIKGYRVWDDQVGIPELEPYIYVAAALGVLFAVAARVMKRTSLQPSLKKEPLPVPTRRSRT
ncbi:MAG TPA: hypothetical protein DDZ88_06055 [Verrucomicrobiales bacterium]|nr:hypothetical protein [Verrucomicrobiales bacterium]